jgi:hypothetical protein
MSARVQKAAPYFSAEALVGTDFKTVSLSDYAGNLGIPVPSRGLWQGELGLWRRS